MSYLLDTIVISEIRKSTPEVRVSEWFAVADSDLTLVTRETETVAETGARLLDPWSG